MSGEKKIETREYHGLNVKKEAFESRLGWAELHRQIFWHYDDMVKVGCTLPREECFWELVEHFWGRTSPRPLERNPWAEKMAREACYNKILSVSGCASSGKTTFFAVWALINWFIDYERTKVCVTSTSIKGARNRIWGQICEYHRNAGYLDDKGKPIRMACPGKIIDSLGLIRIDPKKDRATGSQMSTIELIAAEQSQEKEAVDKLIGIKNEYVYFILDEAPDISPAVMSAAFGNLNVNKNFQLIALGNFKSISDPFGQLSTPVNGWGSVNVDTQEWESTFLGQKGKVIRFDGTRSPNVEAGKDVWKGLYSIDKYKKDLLMGENTVEYWRFCRSFVVPANVSDRVYSESDFIRGKSTDVCRWKTEPIGVSSLDPAFSNGGDKAIATFGLFGEREDGVLTYQVTETVHLREDITKRHIPFDFQIAEQWMQQCRDRGVSPQNAGFDCTGSGMSFGSIVSQVWSPQVLGVAFGGSPTERTVNDSDDVKCCDAYANRVTEIWFQGKEFVRSGQIRGLPIYVIDELTERKRHKNERGTKAQVEPKREMKLRTGKSPDYADSFLIGIDLLRERHGWTAGGYGKAVAQSRTERNEFATTAADVYDENAVLQDYNA